MSAQFLLDQEELWFGPVDYDKSRWPMRKDLAAQFTANASAGAGDDDRSILNYGTNRFMTNLHWRPAEKIVNVQRPQVGNSDASGRELL
jgi:hypothetical protein